MQCLLPGHQVIDPQLNTLSAKRGSGRGSSRGGHGGCAWGLAVQRLQQKIQLFSAFFGRFRVFSGVLGRFGAKLQKLLISQTVEPGLANNARDLKELMAVPYG